MEIPKCINKNQAIYVCTNRKCTLNPFICDACPE